MAKSGGMMDIVMIIVVIGGFLFLWPHLQSAISGLGGGAVVAPTQTDTSGGGKASASDGIGGGADADDIREKTRKMIEDITRQAKSGGGGGGKRGGIRQRNSGGSGTNISVQGGGGQAIACANGKCKSSYGELQMGMSNVI